MYARACIAVNCSPESTPTRPVKSVEHSCIDIVVLKVQPIMQCSQSGLHRRVRSAVRHLEALLKLVHSLPAPAKAAEHAAGHLLCLGVPQDSSKCCLHL